MRKIVKREEAKGVITNKQTNKYDNINTNNLDITKKGKP